MPAPLTIGAVLVVGGLPAVLSGHAAGGRMAGSARQDALYAVAAFGHTVWAVGQRGNGALIERWTGNRWATVSAAPAGGRASASFLAGVAATAAGTWAVGAISSGATTRTLIERWTGRSWQRVPSPNAGTNPSYLMAVAITSPTSAWAVGLDNTGPVTTRTLVEHWNGRSWRRVPSPDGFGELNVLSSVTARTASSTWAVGWTGSVFPRTLAERWTGGRWTVVPSPNLGAGSQLAAVAATSPASAWAVGVGSTSRGTSVGLTERWSGRRWRLVASPAPRGATSGLLASVAALSATRALAVGQSDSSRAGFALAQRWDGNSWSVLASQHVGGPLATDAFSGVVAPSPASAWAVGWYQAGRSTLTLTEHWTGTTWRHVASPSP